MASMTTSGLDDPEFQRAFVAVRVAAGTRGIDPSRLFERPSLAVVSLATSLAAENRSERARVLGAELEVIARRVSAKRLA